MNSIDTILKLKFPASEPDWFLYTREASCRPIIANKAAICNTVPVFFFKRPRFADERVKVYVFRLVTIEAAPVGNTY